VIRGLVVLAWLCCAGPASAQDLRVELQRPEAVRAGDRTEVVAVVHHAGSRPLLLTPRSEGTAIEVVRGRLMRADAVDTTASALTFRIPVVAREPGTSVVRVHVAGYVCQDRCRAVSAEASVVIEVAAATRTGSLKKQSAARTSSLSWVRLEGAESCVASAGLAQAVERQLQRDVFVSAADAALAVEGRVERGPEQWRAVINIVGGDGRSLGERSLVSAEESCAELGEMAAVTIALMIDPLTAPSEGEGEGVSESEGGSEGEGESEGVSEGASEGEGESEGASEGEGESEGVSEGASEGEGESEGVSEGVSEGESEAPVDRRWRFEVDAALVGSVGLVPTPMVGGQSSLILTPAGFVPVVLEGALFPFSRAEHAGNAYADLLHVHAGLQICPLYVREQGLALHGCIGADAGAVIVWGGTLDVADGERLIGQAHAALRGHWDIIGPLTLRVGLHLLVPFRHDPFVANIGGVATEIYRPEFVAGMLDVGVGIHVN